MKKVMFIAFVLSLLFFVSAASAESYISGDFEYSLSDNGDAELICYHGEDGNVMIPKMLDGHPITAVQGNPFVYRNMNNEYVIKDCHVSVAVDHPYLATINGVLFGQTDRKLISYFPSLAEQYEIPQGIWEIGDLAFCGCANLTSIIIPNSVARIGTGAFYCCKSLTDIAIPDSVAYIGGSAFARCTSLTSAKVSEGVTSITYHAFENCTNLSSVTLPNNLVSIDSGAFGFCDSLSSITLPDGLISIGDDAFYGCLNLTSVNIPDSVTEIKRGAFYDCIGLSAITIPDSVTDIGPIAFHTWNDDTSGPAEALPNLVLTVSPGSYAETYCIQNNLNYVLSEVKYGDNDCGLLGMVLVSTEDGFMRVSEPENFRI